MSEKPNARRFLMSAGLLLVLAVAIWSGVSLIQSRDEGAATKQQQPRDITLQLDWVHGGDFAGFYAAERKGFYAAEDVKITFLPGGVDIDSTTSVVEGRAQFGTASAHHLLNARLAGLPVRAIACIYQRSPFVFAAMQGSNIRHPRDFIGKTVRISLSALPTLEVMLAKAGGAMSDVKTVQTRDGTRFESGEIDVWAGFITGAVRRFKSAGHDLIIIYPDDFGIHAYSECLFTTTDVIADQPQLVSQFLRASLKGWAYTLDSVEEVAAMITEYGENSDTQDAIDYVRTSRPLFNVGDRPIGWMVPEVWEGMVATVNSTKGADGLVDASSVYTLEFLNQIYAK